MSVSTEEQDTQNHTSFPAKKSGRRKRLIRTLGSLVPRPTNSLVRRGLARFESFLGCAEMAVLKLGKPIRLLECRKSQDLPRVLLPSLFIVS